MTTEGISGREQSKSKEPVVKKCPGQVQKLMLLLSVCLRSSVHSVRPSLFLYLLCVKSGVLESGNSMGWNK